MYTPKPLNTEGISLTSEIVKLTEKLAKNAHDNWAVLRMKEGWKWGDKRDDNEKTHPCLVPYEELPDSEKVYDRNAAMETIKAILAFGYKIVK